MRGVVKKAKKAAAILALHLSHTPCLYTDGLLRSYITTKLGIRVTSAAGNQDSGSASVLGASPERKGQNSKRQADSASQLDWKRKYELVQRARV